MSVNDRPELRAFRELEGLVRHLGEELAAFRRRALHAEAQLKDAPQGSPRATAGVADDRAHALEAENLVLRARLSQAEERVRQMMERVRFLRQQMQAPTAGAGRT